VGFLEKPEKGGGEKNTTCNEFNQQKGGLYQGHIRMCVEDKMRGGQEKAKKC